MVQCACNETISVPAVVSSWQLQYNTLLVLDNKIIVILHGNVQCCQYYYKSLSLTCLDVTNDNGRTPLDLAVRRGNTEVADYLKSVVSTPEPGMCH